jgi:hypothetical protein
LKIHTLGGVNNLLNVRNPVGEARVLDDAKSALQQVTEVFSKSRMDSFVIHDDENGKSLDVVGDWTPQAAAVLARGEADGLILNYVHGFRERNLVCRGISSLDEIGHLSGLTYLNVSECGDIASFGPLANLHHLKELYAYGSTRVVDGDLSPLTGLNHLTDVRMQNRRDYTPSLKSIKEQIERRVGAGHAS